MPYLANDKVKAEQLRVGDLLFMGDANVVTHSTICKIDVKTKYVHVRVTDHDLYFKFNIGEVVTVVREKLTALEERYANRADAIRRIRRLMKSAPKALNKARSDMHDAMAYGPDWHYHKYEDFVDAQTVAALWADVEKMYQATKMHGNDYEIDLYGCTEAIIKKVTRELLQLRFTSRSTSVMSNTVNDTVMAAKTHWVRDLEYIVIGG
jgi:hypothetical protein